MSKRRKQRPPKVNIVERKKNGKRIAEANIQMKNGVEYDIEWGSYAHLIVFVNDNEYEFELPKWVTWDKTKIYEQGNTIFFEEIESGT